jgi:hypothetical protein
MRTFENAMKKFPVFDIKKSLMMNFCDENEEN